MLREKFVHLHVHTEFSLLDGSARIKELVKAASEMDMEAVAITDHGVMYGVVDFYKACKEYGIKPIIGCEVYVAPRSRFQKEASKDDFQYHLVLLAENATGYQNLIKLVSKGFLEGFYYKPRIDMELLQKYSQGLIGLSACLAGEIPQLLIHNKYDEAKETAVRFNNIFGQDNFFLELQDHGIPDQVKVNKGLVRISRETGIPLVATNDVHYLRRKDARLHDVLLCIQTGKTVEDENRLKFETEEFYFKDPSEMAKIFLSFPDALDNTLEIARRCNVDFDFSQTYLPDYELPAGYTEDTYLRKLCEEGLAQKYDEITPEIKERLDYELSVINKMGYAGYFLIVWDFIRYARENNIMVGPGRGSAAGSLVAYALSITNIDPLRYGLLFERFLNPERVTMPDIDIDFCYEKRDSVIQYVVEKYGADRVAQIITFGTMAARAAVRDVGRALNFPYGEVDRIAKLIPFEPGMTIEKALEQNAELREMYRSEQRYKELIDLAKAAEGLPRHASVHAAGVVIAARPLIEHVPLQKTAEGVVVTQFPMGTLEELGLLKMDFLGLKTLTIMEETVRNVKIRRKLNVQLDNISLEDEKTFQLLSAGDTAGVFQLESSGMRSILRELKPSKFEDIIAVVALYRPGPMEQIPTFIESKHGHKPIDYFHPSLEPILKETYGVMVYQEQIMQVAAKAAGYSLGQADLLRRAIGKKKKEILDQQSSLFIQGCIKKGYSEKVARELFDLILKFASYGFNKSHAAAYALVAYQTAFLKANYTVEFMAATLTGHMLQSDKIAFYINDCKRLGLKVLPPDINESFTNFTVTGEKEIRFGLAAIKNVGMGAIEDIIAVRKKGRFLSFEDFCFRVDLKTLNKKVLESLIKSGAFDSLGVRSQMLAAQDKCVEKALAYKKSKENGQLTMFEFLEEKPSQVMHDKDEFSSLEEFSIKEKLSMEKEVLGLYISGNPLDFYEPILQRISSLQTCSELKEVGNNRTVTLAGIISSSRVIYTKKGRPMAFLSLEDLTGEVEVIVFSDLYERNPNYFSEDQVLIISGRTDMREEDAAKVIAESAILLPKEPVQIFIKIPPEKNLGDMMELRDLLASHRGGVPVYLVFNQYEKVVLVDQAYWVKDEETIVRKLEEKMGSGSVMVQKVQEA